MTGLGIPPAQVCAWTREVNHALLAAHQRSGSHFDGFLLLSLTHLAALTGALAAHATWGGEIGSNLKQQHNEWRQARDRLSRPVQGKSKKS